MTYRDNLLQQLRKWWISKGYSWDVLARLPTKRLGELARQMWQEEYEKVTRIFG